MTATSPTKQNLVCHKFFIQGHVAPKCILLLRDEKQVTANYETLSLAEKVSVPTTSYLCAMQIFGTLKQETSVSSSGITPQTHDSAPTCQIICYGRSRHQLPQHFAVSPNSRSQASSQGTRHRRGKTYVIVAHGRGIEIVITIFVAFHSSGCNYKVYDDIVWIIHSCQVSQPYSTQGQNLTSSLRARFKHVLKPAVLRITIKHLRPQQGPTANIRFHQAASSLTPFAGYAQVHCLLDFAYIQHYQR